MAKSGEKRGPNRQGQRTDPDVRDAIEDLYHRDEPPLTAGRIQAELDARPDLTGRVPRERAIQNIIRQVRQRDPSAPWSLANPGAGRARYVLPVLGALLKGSPPGVGRHVTTLEADWISRLAEAVPQMRETPLILYRHARRYARLVEANKPTEALDRSLALLFDPDPLAGAIASHYEAPFDEEDAL